METDSRELSRRRTVVVSGVPDVLSPDRMIDKLTIHFQNRRRSHGGDVEGVRYPTGMDGVAFITFDRAEDAERVVGKKEQFMTDDQFSEDYILTVFPFSRDVFFYVPNATLDLSAFGANQESLIESLRSSHRSIRFRPEFQQCIVFVEGPFTAIRALREDLILRVSRLKISTPAETAAVKLRETHLNPRVISHHRSVGIVSPSSSEARWEPAGSSSLPPQSTGEASEVQSLPSKGKSQKASPRHKVSHVTLPGGRDGNVQSSEALDEVKTQSRLKLSPEYRTKQRKANNRRVDGEEIKAGIRSSLSSADGLPAEEMSTKQPGKDDISGSNVASLYNDIGYFKAQNSSAVETEFLQNGLTDVLTNSGKDAVSKKGQHAICLEHQEDVWVAFYIFKYIQKFHQHELDRCLLGIHMSVKCVAQDLACVSLTETQTSKAASRIQEALENLKSLELRFSNLRVHEISYEVADQQKLIHICDSVNIYFSDVLYILEDSCIKVIGPPVSSFQFRETVEDKMAKFKALFTNPRSSWE
ncbi:uncharacterized protein KZ484_019036 [Pholidichthys leucotaenia]